MKNQQSFLFFELVSGDILAQVTVEDKGFFPEKELKNEAKVLSKDFGLSEQDIAWVECRLE